MLKGLFWNIRGMSKKGIAQYVRDLLSEWRFDFICFQETILQDFSDRCLRKIDPSQKKF
jgi:exonuclease III